MLILENVSFKYGRDELFKNLMINLEKGNIYGLLWKNGAGKTTLLKIMGGLLFPDSGSCNFNEFNVSKREPGFLENVFFLPEEFFLPPITGKMFVKLRSVFYPNFDDQLLKEYIDDFDLPMDKKLNALSFGQKKKFLLSFGLATGSELIIMDEPTNGLDIPSKTILRRILLKSMNLNKTILISTHQVKDVENLIDSVIILEHGEAVFNKSIVDIGTKLYMGLKKELNGDEIYSQEVMGGFQVILENKTDDESSMDLELLFHGVLRASEQINSIFHKDGNNEQLFRL